MFTNSNITRISQNDNSSQSYVLLFIVLFLFILIPIAGILFSLFAILKCRKESNLLLFMIIISLYLGVINGTKIPSGDQIYYKNVFNNIPAMGLYKSIMDYGYGDIDSEGKEMGYGLYNYLIYYLSFGNYKFSVVINTIVMYMLMFLSYKKYFSEYRKSIIYTLSAVIVIAFFTQLFSFSAHLQRQFLATSLIIYAITIAIEKSKTPYILLVLAFTIHTALALFIPFFFIKRLRYSFKMKNIIFVSIILLLLFSTIPQIGSLLTENVGGNSFGYLGERMAGSKGLSDGTGKGAAGAVLCYPILFVLLVGFLFLQHKFKDKNRYIPFVFHLYLVLSLLIISFHNTPFIQLRFFTIAYTFIPFAMVPLLQKFKSMERFYLLGVSIGMILYFYSTYTSVGYKYAPLIDILSLSPIYLLTNTY